MGRISQRARLQRRGRDLGLGFTQVRLCATLGTMNYLSWIAPSVLAALALTGSYVQQRRITSLETQITELQTAQRGRGNDESAALAQRLERLEKQLAWQASRPVVAGTAPEPAAAPGAAPVVVQGANPGQVQQLREDVDALLTGEAVSTDQGKARLRELISETQRAQWAERQVQRDERIVNRLAESAHLSARQREDVTRALADERTQRNALVGGGRGGQGQPEEVRSQMQALRAQTDQKMRTILDAEQYKQYEASRSFGRQRAGLPGPNGPAAPGAN